MWISCIFMSAGQGYIVLLKEDVQEIRRDEWEKVLYHTECKY